MGKVGKTFLEKSFSLPSPNPIPLFPKTFDVIESLLPELPVGEEQPDGFRSEARNAGKLPPGELLA